MLRSVILTGLMVLAPLGAPNARADLFLTPYGGVNFSGSTVDPRLNAGVSLTWLGARGLGAEIDVGVIPDFFAPRDLELDVLGDNSVTSVMGNVVLARPAGRWRPFVSAGGGLLRSQVGSFGELFDTTDNAFGVNAGAGLHVGGGRVGLRGDVRYFRNLSDVDDAVMEDVLGDFAFWRSTLGLSIRF